MLTKFASSERSSIDNILIHRNIINNQDSLRNIFDSIPNVILILNEERQAIFCNQALLDFMGYKDDIWIFGFRPGEILNCIHSDESEGGCGTTEYCSKCGAVRAILNSKSGRKDVQECRIMVKVKDTVESLDLTVSAYSLEIEKEIFTVFFVVDISHEKRRKVLENIFFHDILNIVGNLTGFIELIKCTDEPEKASEFLKYIDISSKQLIEEIKTQRELLHAENGTLLVNLQPVYSLDFLKNIIENDSRFYFQKEKTIVIDPCSINVEFFTDPDILKRVLDNMIINALESSKFNEIVTIGCTIKDYYVEFRVNNNFVMPKEVQLQVFHRSFSTKGENRGIGTYSMKLLTEKYLNGKIFFESDNVNGTTFIARYNINCNL
jgi:signal transduction histidine kinase